MSNTASVDSVTNVSGVDNAAGSDSTQLDQALNDAMASIGEFSLLQSSSQLANLRDQFQQAISDTDDN